MSADDHQKGTGGLTFEPPTSASHEGAFAADLGSESDAETVAKLFESPLLEHRQNRLSGSSSESASSPRQDSSPAYPRSQAALDTLLRQRSSRSAPEPVFDPSVEVSPNKVTNADLESFQVGPGIALKKSDVVSTPPKVTEGSRSMPEGHDMLDAFFVGEGSDDPSQIHLAFKEDVLGGVHVVLEKKSEGLFARFVVADANTRRHIESTVHVLLQRLKDKGMKVSGYSVTTRDAP